jgi:DnaJ-class molecular chaperone
LNDDPYIVLGVKKDAAQADIQKAYRRLAKTFHPDINPGNPKAESQFKDIAAAYDILGDEAKRKRFDDGEVDTQGADRPRQRPYRDYADSGGNPYTSNAGFSDFEGADDLFSEIFGRGGRGRDANGEARGGDLLYRLTIDFLDAVNGAKAQISLPGGAPLEVTIPPGLHAGQTLRLRGKGQTGLAGGPPGDALVEIEVRPHRIFTRKGDDILVDQPISLAEAVLGGKITVPTPSGPVQMTVPKWTNTGTVLRLKGKGAPNRAGGHGDEYVTLKLTLPEAPDAELERFVSQWTPAGVARPVSDREA